MQLVSYAQISEHTRFAFIGILLFVIAYQLWVAHLRLCHGRSALCPAGPVA